MSNALIGVKKLQSANKIDSEVDVNEENTEIDNSYTVISDENIKPTNFEADDSEIDNEISDTSDES